MKKCRQCGFVIGVFDKVCPRCHTAAPATRLPIRSGKLRGTRLSPSAAPGAVAPQVYVPPPVSNGPLHCQCVVCANEDVRKISAIYNEGTWTQTSRGSYDEHDMGKGGILPQRYGSVRTTTSGSSDLARMLAPPARPRQNSLPSCMFLWIILAGIVAFVWTSIALYWSNARTWLNAITWWIICGALGYYAVNKDLKTAPAQQQTAANALARWQEAMQRWDRLFYCPRCDNVYFPETNISLAASRMKELL